MKSFNDKDALSKKGDKLTFQDLEKYLQTELESRRIASLHTYQHNRFQSTHFFQSLGFALDGLRFLFQTQRNFRIDLALSLVAVSLAAVFQFDLVSWMILVTLIGSVLCAETLNTAIEYTIDWITQGEFDLRAKAVKDISAAACLILSFSAGIVGCLLFIPRVLLVLQR